jgi:hypothetical protein
MSDSSESLQFYRDVKAFTYFQDILENDNFIEAPDDWSVVLTDIKGSTKAIEAGNYKKVNLLGASGIAAVVNVTKEVEIPYVFGGDGATLLVPNSYLDVVEQALTATQRMSVVQFGMELRAGAVPIALLKQLGGTVLVGKYSLSPGNCLAQFRGGGLAKVEELLKTGDSRVRVFQPGTSNEPPDLEGLSCRWEPVISRNGTMLTFLVMSRIENSSLAYGEAMEKIGDIMGHDFKLLNPVSLLQFRRKFSPRAALVEAKMNSGASAVKFKKMIGYLAVFLLQWFIFRFHINFGAFKVLKYKHEMVRNSDFKKFDDMLRMVIDCTLAQADAIETALAKLESQQSIWYGTHRSAEALMTCLVFSETQDNHLHFIDGSDGGYAMAAKQLKAQKARIIAS